MDVFPPFGSGHDGDGDPEVDVLGTLNPNALAGFANLYKCPQFFKNQFEGIDPRSDHDWSDFRHSEAGFSTISEVFGSRFENGVIEHFRKETPTRFVMTDDRNIRAVKRHEGEWELLDEWIEELDESDDPVAFDELRVAAIIGNWRFTGRADIVFVWIEDGTLHVKIAELKSGFEKRSSHQIQATIYAIIMESWLDALLDERDLDHDVSAVVINRETKLPDDPTNLDSFPLTPRQKDVESLVKPDGILDRLNALDPSNVYYQITSKCQSCDYLESCYAHSVEEADTTLLGFSRDEQETFDAMGMDTIHDFARLCKDINEDERDPRKQIDLETRVDDGTYNFVHTRLPEDADEHDPIGLIEQAQVLLTGFEEVEPGRMNTAKRHGHEQDLAWNSSSGYGELPAHRDDLIRAYLHVEPDGRYDRVGLLSAHVESEEGEPERVCEFVRPPRSDADRADEALAEEEDEYTDAEGEMIDRFTDRLFDAILDAASEAGIGEAGKLHFYFFAENSEESLVDALDRHSDRDGALSLRQLLDGSPGIDDNDDEQSMRSIVQSELTARQHSTYPTEGLLPTHDIAVKPHESSVDWVRELPNGDEVNLRRAFERGCFDYSYESECLPGHQTGTRVFPDESPPEDPRDGYFLPVSGSRIPIEYVWAATDRISVDWIAEMLRRPDIEVTPVNIAELFTYLYRDVDPRLVEELRDEIAGGIEDGESDIDALNYATHEQVADALPEIERWLQDHGATPDPITEEDVRALGEQFAGAVADIENELDIRNYEINKHDIPFTFDSPTRPNERSLERALKDFLFMEHRSKRAENLAYYWQKPLQRLHTGRSMLIEVESVEDNGNAINVEARLPYEDVERIKNARNVLNKIRAKDEGGSTSGSWLIANRIGQFKDLPQLPPNEEVDMTPDEARRAYNLENGALVVISDIDIDDQRVRFTAFGYMGGQSNYFDVGHRAATTGDAGEWELPFEENEWYILDPNHDDVVAQNEYEMLGADNELLARLEALVNGHSVNLSSNAFDANDTDRLVELLRKKRTPAGVEPVDPPNAKQRKFITETERMFSLLQGPPGTGKTKTLGGSLIGRAASKGLNEGGLSAAVVGPSHRSVNESLDATAATFNHAVAAADGTILDRAAIEDTLIVRLVSSTFDRENEDRPIVYLDRDMNCVGMGDLPPEVERTIDEGNVAAEVRRRLNGEEPGKHVIVFGTSSALKNLIDELGASFDAVAADEASMLRLPGLLVPGAVLNPDGQILVCGDQRQMPPVLVHDWDSETRTNIRRLVPYLSSLDYFRLLMGDGIEDGEFEGIDIDELWFDPGASAEMTQLNLCYRYPEVLAALLRHTTYLKKDGIDYQAADIVERLGDADPPLLAEEYTVDEMDVFSGVASPPLAEGASEAIFDKDAPIVFIKHDESGSKQSNAVEAAITRAIIDCINDDAYEMGIVTPHNSHRSSLEAKTAGEDWVNVDTVERFQGGEEDCIVVNATESDPDYLTSQSEFILNPNRITVALSRMQHKLVLVASKEIFELIPRDIDEYEDAELWKTIHAALTSDDPAWEGAVTDLLDEEYHQWSETEDHSTDGVKVYTAEDFEDLDL